MTKQNRARVKLVFVFLLFLAPLAGSYVLYYGLHGVMQGGITNKGQLLDPAQPLPRIDLRHGDKTLASTDVLRGQWTYLQVAPAGCAAACRESLRQTRQIWALLHDERSRVQRILLVGGTPPSFSRQPLLEVYSGDLEAMWQLIRKHGAAQPGTVYLVDPHGNWVLYYPPTGDGEGLYRDTKHLLDLSHIG